MRLLRIAPLMVGLLCPLAVAVEPQKPPAKTGPDPTVAKESKPVSFWMEKKLEYAQEILRGLASGDLDEVSEKAEQMRLLSKVEGWVRHRKPGYTAQFQVFEFANAQLLKNAQIKNLDGASIAFQQLTMSCISCHKMLRDVD